MFRVLFLIGLLAFSVAQIPTSRQYRTALTDMTNGVSDALEKEYLKYVKSGVESETLKAITGLLIHSKDILRREVQDLSIIDQTFICTVCKAAFNVLLPMARNPQSQEDIDNDYDPTLDKIAKDFCVRVNIEPKHVCDKVIDFNLPIIIHIIRQRPELTAEQICGTMLQGAACVAPGDHFNWKLNIAPKAKVSNDVAIKPKSEIPEYTQNEKIKILHLTDVHYDPNYRQGALAVCEEPMCCIADPSDVNSTPKENLAGRWSDYRDCDVPWEMYVDSLQQIADRHKDIDIIYYTGDIIHHAVWATSQPNNTQEMKDVYGKLKEVFGNIPVLPAIGNHESQPLNVFAPPNVKERHSTQWLYDYLADEWSTWLPAEAQETIKIAGYYTYSPRPGFRVITLNNNDAYTFNWWIWYDPEYLSKQLEFLQKTLLQAEKDGEYVHILAHVPAGTGSTLNVWAREFRRVIERFSPIISGVFNGHTHKDEFSVFYSMSDSKTPIGVQWNGGSLTPFSFVNPNYRIYEAETKTYQIVEHETYIFNLTEANANPDKSPVWYLEYDFKKDFGIENLSPASLDALLDRFTQEPDLLKKYWEFKYKLGTPTLEKGCDETCLAKELCEAATTQSNDLKRCEELQKKFFETVGHEV
ncbi:sphingomyelin phosphodiesterase-like [Condylostylus longicornis]|uniref:sphingomyelin phosphodiesterase-like n=1 Tax=Condylostylus longicornis TaxID=2530218 RepID=UPI00244DE9E6|nr:sphingomyelin phosphodiesterase-like [Condylostylus longicornis]